MFILLSVILALILCAFGACVLALFRSAQMGDEGLERAIEEEQRRGRL